MHQIVVRNVRSKEESVLTVTSQGIKVLYQQKDTFPSFVTHFERLIFCVSTSQVLFFAQVSHVALLRILCTKLSVNLQILKVNLIYRSIENRLVASIHLFGGGNIDCQVVRESGFCFWEACRWQVIMLVIIWVQAFFVWWLSCLKFYASATLTITISIAWRWTFSLWVSWAFQCYSFYPRTQIALMGEICIFQSYVSQELDFHCNLWSTI